MKKRIIGIDVARALAIIGMIIVNFKIVFGGEGNTIIKYSIELIEGKAAAIFVVLAGVGIALLSNSAILNHDLKKIKTIRRRIQKKSFFLFIIGLSYIFIWPADILHFYGVYMLITLLLLKSNLQIIITIALLFIFIYPLLILVWDYDIGWNYVTFAYSDFWSIHGFFRNLFYNGFHPVIPWTAFMLIGLWFGKQDLNDNIFVKKAMGISLIIFLSIQFLSYLLLHYLAKRNQVTVDELKIIFGTSPIPPLPLYMISGSSISIFIIALCIYMANRFENNFIINALKKTGKLALTFYIAHVIIGMGIIEVINPEKMGNYPIEFSALYALIFSVFCITFAIFWTKRYKFGPLEWVMRLVTD